MDDLLTLYEILEVDRSATDEEIRSAYRWLSHQYHPDKVPAHLEKLRAEGNERFLEIGHAYKILSDPARRRRYDEELLECESRLRGAPPTPGPFAAPAFETHLDFRSGEKAGTLPDACVLIDRYWEEAKQKLHDGDLAGWLGRNGHSVLAADVRAIALVESDIDIAMERVVRALDVGVAAPRIAIVEDELSFGRVERGAKVEGDIVVKHVGARGIVYGDILFPDFLEKASQRLLLRPGQSEKISFEIDTERLTANKEYGGLIETRTNADRNPWAQVTIVVVYPMFRSLKVVTSYGIAGGLIGAGLRWFAGLGGMTTWSSDLYSYSSWLEVGQRTNGDQFLMTVAALGGVGAFWLGYVAGRK